MGLAGACVGIGWGRPRDRAGGRDGAYGRIGWGLRDPGIGLGPGLELMVG